MNNLIPLVALGTIFGSASLFSAPDFPAGETWTETQYFVEKFEPSAALPKPAPDWKIYSKTVVESDASLLRIEQQLGAETPIQTWISGKTVVQRDPDGRMTVSLRGLFDLPSKPIDSWTQDQKPIGEFRHQGMEILVFEAPEESGGERVWIDKASGEVLARWLKKFVTLFTVSRRTAPPLELPAEARAAIETAKSKRKPSATSEAASLP